MARRTEKVLKKERHDIQIIRKIGWPLAGSLWCEASSVIVGSSSFTFFDSWLGWVMRILSWHSLRSLSLSFLFIEFLNRLDLLLEFHPSILKPNLDLSLSQAESMSHFNPSSTCEVMVCVELLLQLKGLISSVSLTASSTKSMSSCKTCLPLANKFQIASYKEEMPRH